MRFRMRDGSVVDTDRAVARWEGRSWYDAYNPATLYKSAKGRYYEVVTFASTGTLNCYDDYMTPERAAGWLELNGLPLPEDLKDNSDLVE